MSPPRHRRTSAAVGLGLFVLGTLAQAQSGSLAKAETHPARCESLADNRSSIYIFIRATS